MFESLFALSFIASLVIVPLTWRVGHDRRKENALKLEARLQSIANQRLGGESYLSVMVEPGLPGHRGRVLLSTPERYRWLVDEVWRDVRPAVPAEYELVVPGEAPTRTTPPRALPIGRAA